MYGGIYFPNLACSKTHRLSFVHCKAMQLNPSNELTALANVLQQWEHAVL